MMATLVNQTKNKIVANHIDFALSFYKRLKGLLGESGLKDNTALWIKSCNSIHTFFMKFSIDVVFVDKNMVVKKCYPNLKPWRVTAPDFRFDSVFELPAGSIQKTNISVGDQLNVVN